MPDIAKVLKTEISRIARRETKKATSSSGKAAQRLRRTTAELKRRIALLGKEVAALRKVVATLGSAQAPPTEAADKARITAKGVRSLRRKLRLTGQDFAKLLGVTGQVVYRWEKSSGPLKVRRKTRAAILAVRELGAREARQRLGGATRK